MRNSCTDSHIRAWARATSACGHAIGPATSAAEYSPNAWRRPVPTRGTPCLCSAFRRPVVRSAASDRVFAALEERLGDNYSSPHTKAFVPAALWLLPRAYQTLVRGSWNSTWSAKIGSPPAMRPVFEGTGPAGTCNSDGFSHATQTLHPLLWWAPRNKHRAAIRRKCEMLRPLSQCWQFPLTANSFCVKFGKTIGPSRPIQKEQSDLGRVASQTK